MPEQKGFLVNFNPGFFPMFPLCLASTTFPQRKLRSSLEVQSYQSWIIEGIFSSSLIFLANWGFNPAENHSMSKRSSFRPLCDAFILKSAMNSSAVLDPCLLMMSKVNASPGLSGGVKDAFNVSLNLFQVQGAVLLSSFSVAQKFCFQGAAVPSFMYERANMIFFLSES